MSEVIRGASPSERRVVRPPSEETIPTDAEGNLLPGQEPPAEGPTVPAACLQRLHSPHPERHGCAGPHCPGYQPDGGCLAEVVRAALDRDGLWPEFRLDSQGYWVEVPRGVDEEDIREPRETIAPAPSWP